MFVGLEVTAVTLSTEAAHRIFETAIDAGHTYGFGYWAKLLEVEQDAAHFITRIQLKEHNDGHDNRGKKGWLDIADLRRGIVAFINDGHSLSENSFDGPTAEMILQFAMFGKEKYA